LVNLGHDLQGPSAKGFSKFPNQSAPLSSLCCFYDAVGILDTFSGLGFVVSALPPSILDVPSEVDRVEWWHAFTTEFNALSG